MAARHAAPGASALLSERHANLLAGIEHADSVVWDAHRMLRTSSLCAAVLVRRDRDLDDAFHQDASYLFYDTEREGVDAIAVECTKAPLGVKLFLNLAWRGERGLGDYVALTYDRTSASRPRTSRRATSLLPLRRRWRSPGGDPRAPDRCGRLPPQLDRRVGRAPPAHRGHGPATDEAAIERADRELR